jgi:hypothetical protein
MTNVNGLRLARLTSCLLCQFAERRREISPDSSPNLAVGYSVNSDRCEWICSPPTRENSSREFMNS